jgi:hypothetical protein
MVKRKNYLDRQHRQDTPRNASQVIATPTLPKGRVWCVWQNKNLRLRRKNKNAATPQKQKLHLEKTRAAPRFA